MEFLPPNYEPPKASNNYLKLQDGENRIRILSRPIIGWEDWHDKKPVRYKLDDKPLKSFDPKKPIKHFWSFIVWNVNEKKIQIMHVTQATIRRALEALCKDPDWGAPYTYDIKISRSGEGIDTEYTINPVPHKEIPKDAIEAFKNCPCNLEALFIGEDPFLDSWETYTPLGTEKDVKANTEKSKAKKASDELVKEFYERATQKYKIEDIQSYLKDWCIHFEYSEKEAIWSIMSDYQSFEESMKTWNKR